MRNGSNVQQVVWMPKSVQTTHCLLSLSKLFTVLSPSADSAYYLGILKDKAGNTTEAITFYEESLKLETDTYRKAEIMYKIASKLKKRGLKRPS